MSDYSHILAAVDFSASADHVLGKAIEIARRNKAKLSLLHVVEYLPPMDSAFDPMLAGNWMIDEDTLLEHAQRSLEKIRDRVKLKNGELEVRLGTPKQEITRYVNEHRCDLVILGSHGRHGLNILLGSTANAVLHAMPCDILTVKVAE